MIDPIEQIEALGGTFVRVSGGEQVWEMPSMEAAGKAIADLKARAFNWCPVQQPLGPCVPRLGRYVKPTVTLPN